MQQGGTISLLPESRRKLNIAVPGENRPFYFGLAVVVLVLVLFGGLKLYRASLISQLAEINNEIASTETQRDKKFEKEAILLNKQFALAGGLLQNHLIWSNVLISLQNLTPTRIQFKTLVGSISESKLEIVGRAPDFTTIAKQIASLLSNPAITDISLDKISNFSTGVLEYNIRVSFDKGKFLFNKEN